MTLTERHDLIARSVGFAALLLALSLLPWLFEVQVEAYLPRHSSTLTLTVLKAQPAVTDLKPAPQQTANTAPLKAKPEEAPEIPVKKISEAAKLSHQVPKSQEPQPERQAKTVPSPKTAAQPQTPVRPSVTPAPRRERDLNPHTAATQDVKSAPEATAKAATKATAKTVRAPASTELPSPEMALKEQEQARLQTLLEGRLLKTLQERTRYPKAARRRGLEGTVLLSFEVRDGKIVSLRVAKSSGAALLDRAALRSAGSLKGTMLDKSSSLTLQVPVVYRLVN